MAAGRKTGGRQKGVTNRATKARTLAIAASGLTPLEYMLDIMRRPIPADLEIAEKIAMEGMRFEAAKAAAPYVHPKLAAIEHTGKDGGPIQTEEISDLEAARRIAFILTKGAAEAVH